MYKIMASFAVGLFGALIGGLIGGILDRTILPVGAVCGFLSCFIFSVLYLNITAVESRAKKPSLGWFWGSLSGALTGLITGIMTGEIASQNPYEIVPGTTMALVEGFVGLIAGGLLGMLAGFITEIVFLRVKLIRKSIDSK